MRNGPPTLDWRYVPSHVAEGPPEVRHADGWLVCETCSDSYARLMASAPDLLQALKDAEMLFQHTFAMDGTVHKAMKAAIAKAEGRS